MAKDILIHTYGYPAGLAELSFDPNFAIRGLCVDKSNGVICKLSHLQRIGQRFAYLGRKQLTAQQIEDFYGEFRTVSSGDIDQMKALNDMFAMAEACLIADVIHTLEVKKDSYGELYEAPTVVDDILSAIKDVHVSGAMHGAVLKDPAKFIKPSPHLRDMLMRFRKAGKKLFLCTNSGVVYAEAAIRYALGDLPPVAQATATPPAASGDAPIVEAVPDTVTLEGASTESWRRLFDVIICSANKPNDFFYGKKPFRQWVDAAGAPSAVPIRTLEQGVIYVNGSVAALRRATGWNSRRVLYVGDNLFADLSEARTAHGWQTACVIEELQAEIQITNTHVFNQLYNLRVALRHLIEDIQHHAEQRLEALPSNTYIDTPEGREGAKIAHSTNTAAEDFAQFQCQFRTPADAQVIADLEHQLHHINRLMSSCFNQQFGSSFRTDGSPSMFAFAVKRFVDLYMDDVCNLSHYSPFHRFFPSHAIHMAHDPVS
jgi:phosphoglycolate phosphatase-like HAD superfamily hydrolase